MLFSPENQKQNKNGVTFIFAMRKLKTKQRDLCVKITTEK